MKKNILILAVLVLLALAGCKNSSITPLELSDIKGPKTVNERTSTEYSVDVSGDQDVTLQWLLEPDGVAFLSNDKSPSVKLHTLEQTGNTSVELTIVVNTLKLGPVKESMKINVVDSNQPPEAKAHCDKPKIGDGQYVQFFNDSTDNNGDTDIYNYEWDFSYNISDGFQSDSLDRDPSHQYIYAGTYAVQLRVTDYAGHTDMLDEPLEIKVVTNVAPIIQGIDRTATTTTADGNWIQLDVEYTDLLPPDDTQEFLWECDCGVFDDSSIPNPMWLPPSTGADCQVKVTVTDWFGLYDEATANLWSSSLPVLYNPNAAGNKIISRNLNSVFSGPINPAGFQFPGFEPDGNVVLVAFWATYASPSVADMPSLTNIYNTFKDREYLQMCVNVGEEIADVEYFVNANSYDASYWLLDPDASYHQLMNDWAGNASNISMYLLFDRDGHCRWAYAGALTPTLLNTLDSAIEELL